MTARDDLRAKCIEAMEEAFVAKFYLTSLSPALRKLVRECMIAAFDALNSIAIVDPLEPTEEMLDGGLMEWRRTHAIDVVYLTMAALGNLTNQPVT